MAKKVEWIVPEHPSNADAPVTWAETVTSTVDTDMRLVKLPDDGTPEATAMYLVRDGVAHPVTTSAAAVATGLAVELVSAEELAAWPMGEPI